MKAPSGCYVPLEEMMISDRGCVSGQKTDGTLNAVWEAEEHVRG